MTASKLVKVKPLEWVERGPDRWSASDHVAGYTPAFTTQVGIDAYEAIRAARILAALDLSGVDALATAMWLAPIGAGYALAKWQCEAGR
jgi:hypothetical protein